VTDEVKALAYELSQTAIKTVEPNAEDVLNAAKTYFVAKRIMAAEHCHGISLNCLGLVETRRIPCPPCMAWLKLNDEGIPGICECDWNAGISIRLCGLLTGRAGLHARPCTEHRQRHADGRPLLLAHQAPRLHQPGEPLILRSHSESGPRRVATGALAGRRTGDGMKFDGPGKMILGNRIGGG